jgi:hypothetical protein
MTDWHRIAHDMAADLEAMSAAAEEAAADANALLARKLPGKVTALVVEVAEMADELSILAHLARREVWLGELADSELTGAAGPRP